MSASDTKREHVEQRLAQQQRNRRHARLFAVIFGLLLVLSSLVQMVSGGYNGPALASLIIVIASAGVITLGFATRAWRWPQMQVKLAPEVLATDRRAPVLYLRPFDADRRSYWYEGRIARSLKGLGPIVTVGRPEEKLPATPYMAREYVTDDRWRDRVVDLIGSAQLVVAQISTSEGLGWELVQVVHLVRPDQLLLCLGPHRIPRRTRGGDLTLRYRQFREQFNGLFPKGLPTELRGSVFIAFDSDWTPIPSRELTQNGHVNHPLTRRLERLHRRLA